MKGANGIKRVPVDGTPTRSTASAPIGSPAAASLPKRRPGKGYTTPPRASSDVAIYTPPEARPPAAQPPGLAPSSGVAIPKPGCSAEELRAFVVFAANFNRDATADLELRSTEQANAFRQEVYERFNKIEPALDHTKDVSLFSKVAKLVTPEALQNKFDEF